MIDRTRSTNPYSPPSTIGERSLEPERRSAWWVLALLVAAALAYHLFVLVLYLSPPDRRVSIWFLANTPVIFVWLFRWYLGRRDGAIFGIIASVVQLIIAVALLLVLDHADLDAVVGICGTIIACFLALAWICHRQSIPVAASLIPENTASDLPNSRSETIASVADRVSSPQDSPLQPAARNLRDPLT